MPWFCAYCSRWSPSANKYCTSCGRSGRGRLCRKCNGTVAAEAQFCAACGGERFIESAVKRQKLTPAVRTVVLITVPVVVILTIVVVLPLLRWLFLRLVDLSIQALTLVAVVWLMTALLPDGPRQTTRRILVGVVRFFFRVLGNLVR